MREERRVVTALSADLVGSTAITERARSRRRRGSSSARPSARMVHAVEEFGGTSRISPATASSPSSARRPPTRTTPSARCVRAPRSSRRCGEFAREVERELRASRASACASASTPAPVVVGPVGAGSRVEYGATGDTVNVAARLQSAAEPGAVLVGAETRRLAERQFDWGDRQALDAEGQGRGGRRPGRRSRARPRPAARRSRRRSSAAQPELGQARGRRSKTCRPGAGCVLFVTGEPGSARAASSPSCAASRREPIAGSRAAASRTASRCRTGRSATCSRDWLGLGARRARAARPPRAAPRARPARRRERRRALPVPRRACSG